MSATVKHTRGYVDESGASLTYEFEVECDLVLNIPDMTIPAGTTDKQVPISIDVSTIKSLFIGSNKAITVEINNPGGASAAADYELEISADNPVDWNNSDPEDCPLTGDVTTFWITNLGADDATFNVRCGVDATPGS